MQVIYIIFTVGISEIPGKEASMIIVNKSAPKNRRFDSFKVNLPCVDLQLRQFTIQEGRGFWQKGVCLGVARKGGNLRFSIWTGLLVFMESATGI